MSGQSKARHTYLLSGLLHCGKCDSAMVGNRLISKGKEYIYYECAGKKRTRSCDMPRIASHIIEGAAIKAIYHALLSPEVIDSQARMLYQSMEDAAKHAGGEEAETRKQLAQAQKEIDNIVNAIAAGAYSDALRLRLETLEGQKGVLENRIRDIETMKNASLFTVGEVKAYLSSFSDILDAAPERQKTIIKSLVLKLTFCQNAEKRWIDLDTIAFPVPKVLDLLAPPRGLEPLLPP